MRLKFIIGILALLLLMVSTASAETLGNCNNPVALKDVSVTASPSSGEVTFEVTPIKGSGVTYAWLKDVGIPTDYTKIGKTEYSSVTVATDGAVKDEDGNDVEYDVDAGTMAGFIVVKVALPGGENDGVSKVTVTYSGTIPSDPVFVAHACWTPWISGQYDSNGAQLTSAMFSSGGNPPTQVPEFPTVALPVAAILGLMFIFGRKKQE